MGNNIFKIYGNTYSKENPPTYNLTLTKKKKHSFSQSISRFLHKKNGLIINNNDYEFVFEINKAFGPRDDLRFDGFYSAKDIFLNFKHREGVAFPYGNIPFVNIELAEICISLREDSFGYIYFCEQDPYEEQLPENDFESAMNKFNPSENKMPGTMIKLANSFEDFIENIKVEKW
ncbi:hypothetical protein CPU12_09030 [Malaciobacter molluscorum LMG 25693]|uniref:Knr4/Smi1-like domain-containing protein n=1 Tax=Malaciobacter molluscorum LMG 25693 TaxID=870501 RepID=A0A2G1DGX0_9BACT|nr:hypothetical protein [Malaciobacter molluscorum]PHO17727.1 hypothetical protein CPU12_09030 [Malaciobacter molluscorum LMG 25693]